MNEILLSLMKSIYQEKEVLIYRIIIKIDKIDKNENFMEIDKIEEIRLEKKLIKFLNRNNILKFDFLYVEIKYLNRLQIVKFE